MFLTVDQEIVYGLYIPGDGSNDYNLLCETPLKIQISYNTLNRDYKEKYKIDFEAYNYMVNTSDFVRMKKKEIKVLKEMNEELKCINRSISK